MDSNLIIPLCRVKSVVVGKVLRSTQVKVSMSGIQNQIDIKMYLK